MQVLVLADEIQRADLLAMPVEPDIRIEFALAPQPTARPDACIDLLFENDPGRIAWLRSLECPILINAVHATLEDIGEKNMIRINAWPGFFGKPLVEAAAIDSAPKEAATALLQRMGRKVAWVPDVAGFISGRVISSIINEAFFALEESVSTAEEIDVAMKLGTNYPYGPFEWGQKIGLQSVFTLLQRLSAEQGRYQPSSLLKQRALA